MAMEPSLLRVDEVAKLLSVSRWTVYRWIEEGRLQGTKLNRGSLRIFRASVTALVEGHRTPVLDQPIRESRRQPVAV
jgi:excisionase family DNA binding protein